MVEAITKLEYLVQKDLGYLTQMLIQFHLDF